jgi:hypothetical protein
MRRDREALAIRLRNARIDRALARAPRYLFLTATVILSTLGARAILAPSESAPSGSARPSVDHASEDFAERFARAYLSIDPDRPTGRERALSGFGSDALDLELASDRPTVQQVRWTQVAQNQEAIAGGRVIVVAAGVSSQTEPLYLAVPVERDEDGAIGLGGYPALIGPPSVSTAAVVDRQQVDDAAIARVVRRALANYLAGDSQNLAADLAPHALVSIPTRELALRSLDELAWAGGEGSSAVLATVAARDSEHLEWTLTYEVGIASGPNRPYVTFIETVPNAP